MIRWYQLPHAIMGLVRFCRACFSENVPVRDTNMGKHPRPSSKVSLWNDMGKEKVYSVSCNVINETKASNVYFSNPLHNVAGRKFKIRKVSWLYEKNVIFLVIFSELFFLITFNLHNKNVSKLLDQLIFYTIITSTLWTRIFLTEHFKN